jgi:hypothetical protein
MVDREVKKIGEEYYQQMLQVFTFNTERNPLLHHQQRHFQNLEHKEIELFKLSV